MPFKILLFLSITLLAACTAQPSTTSPANATLSLTEAPAPIAPTAATGETPPTPTPKPTASPATPTETRDPNMPPGATGKDAQGNYIKIENGVQVAWNAELNTWERHLNVNDEGIPLLAFSQQSHDLGIPDQIWLHVSVSDNVSGFEHLESISFHSGAGEGTGPSFKNVFLLHLDKRVGPKFEDTQQILKGEVSQSFTTLEGPQSWKLGPHTTVEVDILEKPVGNGFQDWKDPSGTHFQSRMFTDESGNLHLWIVPGVPVDQLTKEQLLGMYLFAPASVISDPDQRVLRYSTELSTYVTMATNPSLPPFFDFGPPQ